MPDKTMKTARTANTIITRTEERGPFAFTDDLRVRGPLDFTGTLLT